MRFLLALVVTTAVCLGSNWSQPKTCQASCYSNSCISSAGCNSPRIPAAL
jgi:hypothetical protein